MHATLPDISVTDIAPGQIALDWVGMQGIDLPVLGGAIAATGRAGLSQGFCRFVEDAARRVQSALADHYLNPRVHVCHEESLHPHDAVAWAGAFEGDGS